MTELWLISLIPECIGTRGGSYYYIDVRSEDLTDIGQKKKHVPLFGRRSMKKPFLLGFWSYVFIKNHAFLVVMFSTLEYKTHPCITSILKKMYSTRKTDLLGERLNRWIVDSRKAGCHWASPMSFHPRSVFRTVKNCTHFQTWHDSEWVAQVLRMLLAWGSNGFINSGLSWGQPGSIWKNHQFLKVGEQSNPDFCCCCCCCCCCSIPLSTDPFFWWVGPPQPSQTAMVDEFLLGSGSL